MSQPEMLRGLQLGEVAEPTPSARSARWLSPLM